MVSIKFARTVPARATVVGAIVPSDRLRQTGIDKRLLNRVQFSGDANKSASITTVDAALFHLVGIGPSGDVTSTDVRKAVASAVRSLGSHKSIVIDLTHIDPTTNPAIEGVDAELDTDAIVQAAAEGAGLACYSYDEYRAESDEPKTGTITLVVAEGGKAGLARGISVVEAVSFARDLVNEPGGSLTPKRFADIAKERATAAGLTVEVLNAAAIKKERLGGLLSVSRGSTQEPRLVKLTYTPTDAAAAARPSVGLVGKGVTFDSGGLSIKPGEGMMTMKMDMGGAAAVIASMCALPSLEVGVPVTSYTPLTDNMLGGDATRPGDVMTARNGKTVEILNTDAEGRLILADALCLASEAGHSAIVDLATLTGACMVALGGDIAGLMGNDGELLDELTAASDRTGEQVWHLPLPPEYRKMIESPIADIKNIGGKTGGALTAGLFLQEFVDPETPWAHIDIAGPAWIDAQATESAQGGTGFGVRLLIDWLESRALTEPTE